MKIPIALISITNTTDHSSMIGLMIIRAPPSIPRVHINIVSMTFMTFSKVVGGAEAPSRGSTDH